MKFLIVFCAVLASSAAKKHSEEHYIEKFEEYQKEFGVESNNGFEHFKNNFDAIEAHNIDFDQTFSVGLNALSHKSPSQLKTLRGRKKSNRTLSFGGIFSEPIPDEIFNIIAPASLDYRDIPGMINPVRNQGDYSSGYAFAVAGALEAQIFKKTGESFELSKQQIVDCNTGDDGCDGNLEYLVYQYLINNGIASEKDYPYTGPRNSCEYKPDMSVIKILDYNNMLGVSADNLKKVLAAVGPVSIGINASDEMFASYQTGIYKNVKLGSKNLDHSVLLVGYKGNSYWIVKNSWGPTWGYQGYGYIAQGAGDIGVGMDISYPIV